VILQLQFLHLSCCRRKSKASCTWKIT